MSGNGPNASLENSPTFTPARGITKKRTFTREELLAYKNSPKSQLRPDYNPEHETFLMNFGVISPPTTQTKQNKF